MKKINDLKKGANIFVVIGEVGTGKTSLVKSYEGHKVVFSFDASYSSLDGVENLDVYSPEIEDLNNSDDFVKEVEDLTKNADLIVFDNLSALQNTFVDAMEKGKIGGNTDTRAAYGKLQGMLNTLTQWCLIQNKDFLFTFWAKKIEKANSSKSTIEYDMNNRAFNMIGGYAKTVSRTENGIDGYSVVMNADGNGLIKNRFESITKTSIKNSDYWSAIEYGKQHG